MSKSLIPSAI